MHYPSLNHKERCEIKNFLPLLFRSKMTYINCFTSQCIRLIFQVVKRYIPNPRLRSNRKGLLLQPQQLRTETHKRFYTNRIVTLLSRLPTALRVDQSFSIFVNELDVFLCAIMSVHGQALAVVRRVRVFNSCL